MISVILPAYNEEQMIRRAADTISGILTGEGIEFELLFVDDGSRDKTWERIRALCSRDPRVVGVHFSRNFGKEAALFAGLEQAQGDCCVVLDCDLQHPPEKIVDMYRLWEQGYQVVEGVKENRGRESPVHGLAARVFYRMISGATGLDMVNSSDFKLLDRKVVDALNQLPERQAFFRALSYWVGFRKTSISYRVRERTAGESKWSTKSLIRYAMANITSFSTAPMQLVSILGVVMLALSLVLGGITLYQKLTGTAAVGFTTVIIIQTFSSSIIMLSLGIIGVYIAKIYQECQRRPRYLISEICARGRGEMAHKNVDKSG